MRGSNIHLIGVFDSRINEREVELDNEERCEDFWLMIEVDVFIKLLSLPKSLSKMTVK